MNILDATALGLVQGLTEFLPVSSSGHLVLAAEVLDAHEQGLGFEVWVHLATLLALVWAIRRDIVVMARGLLPGGPPGAAREGRRLWLLVIVGTIPAVVYGVLARRQIDEAFLDVRRVGVELLITAAFLFATRFIPARNRPLTVLGAFLIGVAQAVSILPGISRSGATLAVGLAVGLSGKEAARFSFLLAFPAILGAAILEASSMVELSHTEPLALALSFLASGVSGYFAIRMVWGTMTRGRLYWFAPYCAAVGIAVLLLA